MRTGCIAAGRTYWGVNLGGLPLRGASARLPGLSPSLAADLGPHHFTIVRTVLSLIFSLRPIARPPSPWPCRANTSALNTSRGFVSPLVSVEGMGTEKGCQHMGNRMSLRVDHITNGCERTFFQGEGGVSENLVV